MKRNLIALAVAAAFVVPVANAAPKVYGKLNVSQKTLRMTLKVARKTLGNYQRFTLWC
jgi:hypothetical protein